MRLRVAGIFYTNQLGRPHEPLVAERQVAEKKVQGPEGHQVSAQVHALLRGGRRQHGRAPEVTPGAALVENGLPALGAEHGDRGGGLPPGSIKDIGAARLRLLAFAGAAHNHVLRVAAERHCQRRPKCRHRQPKRARCLPPKSGTWKA